MKKKTEKERVYWNRRTGEKKERKKKLCLVFCREDERKTKKGVKWLMNQQGQSCLFIRER